MTTMRTTTWTTRTTTPNGMNIEMPFLMPLRGSVLAGLLGRSAFAR
jgi:hypothetical protein